MREALAKHVVCAPARSTSRSHNSAATAATPNRNVSIRIDRSTSNHTLVYIEVWQVVIAVEWFLAIIRHWFCCSCFVCCRDEDSSSVSRELVSFASRVRRWRASAHSRLVLRREIAAGPPAAAERRRHLLQKRQQLFADHARQVGLQESHKLSDSVQRSPHLFGSLLSGIPCRMPSSLQLSHSSVRMFARYTHTHTNVYIDIVPNYFTTFVNYNC